jgi:hypothetical protein
MANPESRIQFPDGVGATQHKVVVLPAGGDANVTLVGALAEVVFANVDGADEDIRLGDITVPNAIPAQTIVIQVQTSQPAASAFSAPVEVAYAIVGVPGPVVIV